jgi:hypothetical protein
MQNKDRNNGGKILKVCYTPKHLPWITVRISYRRDGRYACGGSMTTDTKITLKTPTWIVYSFKFQNLREAKAAIQRTKSCLFEDWVTYCSSVLWYQNYSILFCERLPMFLQHTLYVWLRFDFFPELEVQLIKILMKTLIRFLASS